jgi:2-polyprenyl-3-methyl-5-hydroxy-6-metoxy-1,4-benzoquinol methylase
MSGEPLHTPEPDPALSQTQRYLQRGVDGRMVGVIDRYITATTTSVLDIACGSGLYGAQLGARGGVVDGVDLDPELVAAAQATGSYRDVAVAPVEQLAQWEQRYHTGFCSEFLEHTSNDQFPAAVAAIENVIEQRIIITVPNPWSPHFRHDPTHVLKYRASTMLKWLNRSERFSYEMLPLGFADEHRTHAAIKLLQPVSSRVARLSPTVLYVGQRRI